MRNNKKIQISHCFLIPLLSIFLVAALIDSSASAAPLNRKEIQKLNALKKQVLKYMRKRQASEALPLAIIVAEKNKKIYGEKHLYNATTNNNLGHIYQLLGQYGKAIFHLKKALYYRKNRFKPDVVMVANLKKHLGNLYKKNNQFALAEKYYLETLNYAARHQSYGMRSLINRESIIKNLHEIYEAQGLNKKANKILTKPSEETPLEVKVTLEHKELHKAILKKYSFKKFREAHPLAINYAEKVREKYGDSHLKYAVAINNLAAIQESIGNHLLAEKNYKKALSIRENLLGAHHILTAKSIDRLAAFYFRRKSWSKAFRLFERSFTIEKKNLGSTAYALADKLDVLGKIHEKQKQYAEAIQLYKRALFLRKKVLKPENYLMRRSFSYRNLSNLYKKLSHKKSLNQLQQNERQLLKDNKILKVQAPLLSQMRRARDHDDLASLVQQVQKKYGTNHINFIEALAYQAGRYFLYKQYDEAKPIYMQSIAIQEIFLGPRDAAFTAASVGSRYTFNKEYETAEEFYKKSLALWSKAESKNHPFYIYTLFDIAKHYVRRHEYLNAAPLYEKAITAAKYTFGPYQSNILVRYQDIVTTYDYIGKTEEARQAHNRYSEFKDNIEVRFYPHRASER